MASDDFINKTLGHGQYEIRSVLGRGGMAIVYLARQASMNRDVAVKVMTPELTNDQSFVTRFEHEAELIAHLQHPHILPVIDFGRDDKHLYIVMRLVRGGSLDDRLAEGPLPMRLASRMMTQIASALTFAHEQGIIHRDLKPNNVLLDERNNAYLTDFGIAKMLAGTTQLTATGHILGTPAYMAPEQWRGEPVDARTDVYALGILLYEMLLGRPPFKADTPFTYMHHHVHEQPPPPRRFKADFDPGVEAVVLRALNKEPDARYQSPDDLAEDLNRAVQGLPTRAPAPPPEIGDMRTVIGEDELPAPFIDTMPTFRPDSQPDMSARGVPAPRTPHTEAAGTRAAPDSTAAGVYEAVPPRTGGLNPVVIGGALVGILAVIAVVAFLVLGGGGDDKKVAEVPTATETSTPEPTEPPTATATPRQTFATVVAERANVRSGPGTNYDVLGTLARDEEIQVIGVTEDGGWYQVLFGTQFGWVSAEIVRVSGNPNIDVIVLPTETPVPTATPTETPLPTETPTLIPTAVPSATPTDVPTAVAVLPVEADVFVPSEFERVTLGDLGLSLDHPTNWAAPRPYSSLGYVSLHPLAELDNDRYPWFRVARGAPAQHETNQFTLDTSSARTAAENTVGLVSSIARELEGYAYPTYEVHGPTTGFDNWAWVVEVAANDWVYIILYVPKGDYYELFAQNVIPHMIASLQIDGVALVPSETQLASGFDVALFLPTDFARVTLATGISFEQPANWMTPVEFNGMAFMGPVDSDHPLYSDYPSIAMMRGSPAELKAEGMTDSVGSLRDAVEHPYNTDFSGMSEVEDRFVFPAYWVNFAQGGLHAWVWGVQIGVNDWFYMVALAPSGQYDAVFEDQVLKRILTTLEIEGQPLVVSAGNTERLTSLPMQRGEPVLDRFNDNTNDWQYGELIENHLFFEAPELEYVRWSYPSTLELGDPAYYAQITGSLASDTDKYQLGLAFRVVDGSNFYYYTVDNNGQVLMLKGQNGEWIELAPVTVNANVQVGLNVTNTLGVLVIGDYFEFYLNGELIGTAIDNTHKTGGARPVTYTFADSSSVVGAAFDDYAYIPITIVGHDVSLGENGVIPLGMVVAPTDVLSEGASLGTLNQRQTFVALARSENDQYVYGYGRGLAGWVASADLVLTLDGESLPVSALPILDSAALGTVVSAWPVAFPAESAETGQGTALMIAYDQTVEDTIAEGGTVTWLFSGVAGEVVTISTASPGNSSMDLKMRLIGPNGAVLAEDDDSGPGLHPSIAGFALPTSGLYTIEIECLRDSGSFQLALAKQ